jgi:hypothetical protein
MTEKEIERRMCGMIHARGGLAYKLIGLVNGLPDRLVILPDGKIWFVELKAGRNKLSKIQAFRIAELKNHGANVRVIRGWEAARAFVEEVLPDGV